ncbi:Futalosine hydrolase [Pseudodesulfovibrio profundus]|uniref:Futalosine hydrolase n=1 Tax=Pseudodesulfovibrio profundus TaxID=57320 RepID=A0A2C8F9M3_9BACT|nr:futalosine hydrolase [Pseudodesulfovibrio profundus]MBC15909.1 futalosine hydrolase [Desulfovibrio sp.]SOB59477.1 Futalosine hydrolase [Pseudodesulfovibrio profundus]|tara:strand:- start:20645 stop:21343 length:699 start_codon:yes stop_codon:yes gene_type:complete
MIAVVTATAKEMKSALGHAGAPSLGQGDIVSFKLGERVVLLAVCGVGLLNAALLMGRLMERGDVTGVVNFGIAGAYDVEEFPLGTTTYLWQEAWPEYGLLQEDGRVDSKAIGFPQGEIDGKPVWDRVKLFPVHDAETMGLTLHDRWARAAGVSVNSVTGTPERAGWLKMACNGDVENMEGYALAFAAKQVGLPFLELRTVSNLVGSRYAEDWDLPGAFAALGQCAKFLFSGR